MSDMARDPFRILAEAEVMHDSGLESLSENTVNIAENAVPRNTDVILDRIETNLKAMSPANLTLPKSDGRKTVTEQEWNDARDKFLRTAKEMFNEIGAGTAPSRKHNVVAEAVIIADKTRPSFLLRDGDIDLDDPFRTHWSNQIAVASGNSIDIVSQAVGRIQPQYGSSSNFFGTGSLISIDEATQTGLVLTNYHVIEDAKLRGVTMTRNGHSLDVIGHLEIDFLGEAHSIETNRFRITKVIYPNGANEVFKGIDAAVAIIEKIDGEGDFPNPIIELSAKAQFITADIGSIATIGFPQRPYRDERLDSEEWDFVIETLFQDSFGVKRLAPGRISRSLGSHSQDIGKRAIGHDATTFGGASGSLIFAWQKFNSPAFSLHFGGLAKSANYALSFHVEETELSNIQVPFTM